jgi:DNA-binding CsgD family transcriptional regulator
MKIVAKELDDQDRQILKLIADGLTNKEIAYDLRINPHSVKARLRVMRAYYDCKTTAQLLLKLSADGLLVV